MHYNIELGVLLLFWLRQGLTLCPGCTEIQSFCLSLPNAGITGGQLSPSVDCYILPLHNFCIDFLLLFIIIIFFTKVQGI